MQVRIMIGPKAGQIVGVSPEAAHAMLADGRALAAYDLLGVEIPLPVKVAVAAPLTVVFPAALQTSATPASQPAAARLKGAKR